MGLDITAYEKLTLTKAITLKEWNAGACDEYDDGIFLYKDHSSRTQQDDMPEGVYESHGERLGFRAGSYGGYNEWRAWLARLVGKTARAIWNDPQPGPFVELINFSDCEGFIGPKTSAKLAKDFDEWAENAAEVAANSGDDGEWFASRYADWRKAFHLASNGGAIKFH